MGKWQSQMENLEVMQQLFGNVYAGKTILITGHTGFKGSWLTLWLHQLGAIVSGYSLDEVTTPSHFKLLNIDVETQYGDIRDKQKLEAFFSDVQPEVVFHLAAQSLVRESYRNVALTYETNITGTLNVFEAARKCNSVKAIINVTTDKVYENLEQQQAYQEQDRLGGHDPYSSSKACSEILTSSYRNSFLKDGSILLASARSGNVIGGGDWANERLIPDIMRSVSNNKVVEIRSPESVRPWEHVLEPLSGYLLLGKKLLQRKNEFAEAWNFGPKPEQVLQVRQILEKMQQQWNKINFKINEENAKQFHEAKSLQLNCTKAYKQLKWKPVWSMDKTIEHTINWYKNYFENKALNSLSDLKEYAEDAKKMSLSWTL